MKGMGFMNLQHLRYFTVLAQFEHYTLAAKQLHITQPTLSHAIATLEQELGVSLFEKEGRNVILTKSGRQFYEDISHILVTLDTSLSKMQAVGKGAGYIDVALLRTLSHQIVPNLARNFLENNAENNIIFDFHNDSGMSRDIINGLRDKKYDLVFCSKIDKQNDITFYPFAEQDLVLIVPEDHPLAKKTLVDLNATLDYPQIWFSKRSGMRPILDQLFDSLDKRPHVQYEVEEDETIAGLVSQGFGIAVMPKISILDTIKVKIINLKNLRYRRLYYMAYLTDAYHTPAVNSFIQYVKTNCQLPNI
ncbi:MAG: LysR family transcriptional regulator [Tetragenococcus koreensis]|nr:LysR family transcriptional regulator [Tetragenococcus koreensis]